MFELAEGSFYKNWSNGKPSTGNMASGQFYLFRIKNLSYNIAKLTS
jgi:hypothetical protein